MSTIIQYDEPYVLETIIEKYKKQNEALEKRESAIIKVLTNMRQERVKTTEIEDKIRTAILSSKNFSPEVVRFGDRKQTHYPIPDVYPSANVYPSSSVYPSQLAVARERVIPRSRYSRFDTVGDFDLGSRSINNKSRRKCPNHNVNPCSERVLSWAHNVPEICEPLKYHSHETLKHSLRRGARDCARDAREQLLDLNPTNTRWFDDRFQPSVDNTFSLPFPDSIPYDEYTSPSIQEILHRYRRTHVNSIHQDIDADYRVNLERRRKREEENHQGNIIPVAKSESHRQIKTSGNTFQTNISAVCNPYSDTNSNESVKRCQSPRPNTDKSSGSYEFDGSPHELHERQYTSSREINCLNQEGLLINDSLEHYEECQQYEFDEDYSNNYLTFLIRNCLPRSLLRSHYSSSYNWSSENKEDILTKTEEIDIIKKIICEELDYRESVRKPFKIHRDDRKVLLRNIMYAEAVKLGLSKGLPICGVMALFAETRSAENAKQLTLQTIRQANELLGEHHTDPVGLEAIQEVAARCAAKLETFKFDSNTSSKLSKILQDVISREPILDARATLLKCIEDLQNFQGLNETQTFEESDLFKSEICRLKNIIWSVEEYNIVRSLRENMKPIDSQSVKTVGSARLDTESTAKEKTLEECTSYTRQHLFASDSLVNEHAGLKREIKHMKSIVLNLEHNPTLRETGKKKEIERISEGKNNMTSDSNTISRAVKPKEARCESQEIGNKTLSKTLQTNPKDSAAVEHETLKKEVNRLKLLIESMERRLDVNENTKELQPKQLNPPQTARFKTNGNNLNTGVTEADNGAKLGPEAYPNKYCVSSDNNNKKNTAKICKVLYLVKTECDTALDVEVDFDKNIHTQTKSISYDGQHLNPPIILNNQMTIPKDEPSIMCQHERRGYGKMNHVETIATQTSNVAFCGVRAVEQVVANKDGHLSKSPDHSDARYPLQATETRTTQTVNKSILRSTSAKSNAAFCGLRAVEQVVTNKDGHLSRSPDHSDARYPLQATETRSTQTVNKSISRSTSAKSNATFCGVRAVEQVVANKDGHLSRSPDHSDARYPVHATETRSTQTVNKSISRSTSANHVTVNYKTKCASNKPSETEVNKTVPKRKTMNPAENMWEDMVVAIIPSISSMRCLQKVESTKQSEVDTSSKAKGVTNSLSGAADPSLNSQPEENIFKIIHKSGSAYEISSSLNLDNETKCPSTGPESTEVLLEDLSQQLTKVVMECAGTETRHCLEEFIKESYVTRYEKAINDTLKEIINNYPPTNSCGSLDSKTSTAKKKPMKRPATAPSRCTGNNIVVVGTTEATDGQETARNPSFTSVISYSRKKKKRRLSAMKYDTSNTTIDDGVLSKENELSTTMIEKATKRVIDEPSSKKLVPGIHSKQNTISSLSTEKRTASYRAKFKSSSLSKSKSQKVSSNVTARRSGNKKEQIISIKAKNTAIVRKADEKPGRSSNKISDKEGTKSARTSKYTKESVSSLQNSGPKSRIKAHSDEKCTINGIVSRKTPARAEGEDTRTISKTNGQVTKNKKVSGIEANSSISILFAGENWMDDLESISNSNYMGAESTF